MKIDLAVLDNDKEFLQVLRLGLEAYDIKDFFSTHDTNEFMAKVKQPAVLIVDINLDFGISGIDVMRRVIAENPMCHIIFMSCAASVPLLIDIINEGWGCYFVMKDKSDFLKELSTKIDKAFGLLRTKMNAAKDLLEKNAALKAKMNDTIKLLD